MLTYSFDNKGSHSLYEHLYNCIKQDILTSKIQPGEKLPSKRALAKHLNISSVTVENSYNQLMAEGYIYSIPKSGFYVCDISTIKPIIINSSEQISESNSHIENYFADFVNNSSASDTFPFTTWTKLMRRTISDSPKQLMTKSPSCGIYELRSAIANYLYQFRGMNIFPEQIVIGAGTEYLYGLIIQLLGRKVTYAVEDPGYQKISHIYNANEINCIHIPIDKYGIHMPSLYHSDACVIHISPSHHFPTGIITPINRRYELLKWVSESDNRYIIEDDYDSEFRLSGKPIPSLYSIDSLERTIYVNTFSKSLSSTIRISYMVLPKKLLNKYNKTLNFYSCTVPNFEQYTLARFINEGHLEKHINRMRNYYRSQRDIILSCIKKQPNYNKIQVKEADAGLHFLIEIDTPKSDTQIIQDAKKVGLNILCLSQYYYNKKSARKHTLVINYSGLPRDIIPTAIDKLFSIF